MSTIRTLRTVALLSIALLAFFTITGAAYAGEGEEHGKEAGQENVDSRDGAGEAKADSSPLDGRGMAFLAVGITMASACLSAALAVGKVGAAAMGAAAEKPEILTKAIVFAGLGEGIAIFGLIVSLFLINKL